LARQFVIVSLFAADKLFMSNKTFRESKLQRGKIATYNLTRPRKSGTQQNHVQTVLLNCLSDIVTSLAWIQIHIRGKNIWGTTIKHVSDN